MLDQAWAVSRSRRDRSPSPARSPRHDNTPPLASSSPPPPLARSPRAAVPAAAPAVGRADKLAVGLIGCGGMGTNHLKLLAANKQLNIAYVCDVDANRLAAAAKIATDAGHPAKTAKDLRSVLDDKAVNAVWMATPDHWHAPAAILAADAGKHVYVEKPCSHNVREGRLMIDAAKRNKVVIQVGTQSRSTQDRQGGDGPHPRRRDRRNPGREGVEQPEAPQPRARQADASRRRTSTTTSGSARRRKRRSTPTASTARGGSSATTGPATSATTASTTSTSASGGMGFDALPNRVAALGGKYFFDDDQEWPDTQYVVCEYDAGNGGKRPRQFIFEQRIWSPYVQEDYENGCAFYGTKGMLIIGHSVGWKLYGERNKPIEEMKGRVESAGRTTRTSSTRSRRVRSRALRPKWGTSRRASATWRTSARGCGRRSSSIPRPKRSATAPTPTPSSGEVSPLALGDTEGGLIVATGRWMTKAGATPTQIRRY